MKERDFRDYITDIYNAICEVEEFTKGLDFGRFEEDRKTVNATVRSLEVIGEAAKRIPAHIKEKYPSVPWKKMAAMRDKLIHEYFGVDETIVWKVASEELPKLKPAFKEVVGELLK